MKKKLNITKADVLSFLGLVGTAIITTLISRFTAKQDVEDAVANVLAEERRQIAEMEAKNAKKN